jgi:thioredoxin reductase
MALDSKIPEGPLADKWTKYKSSVKLVNPANKRKLDVLVIGTGLAGASAAASLAELGYKVKAFCFQDSPAAPTVLPHKAVSTLLKTIKTTATAFTVCFTIPLKVVITVQEKQTYIVWPK